MQKSKLRSVFALITCKKNSNLLAKPPLLVYAPALTTTLHSYVTAQMVPLDRLGASQFVPSYCVYIIALCC